MKVIVNVILLFFLVSTGMVNAVEKAITSDGASKVSTIKHTAGFNIKQPIDDVFPLFSAEGEKLWAPGWDYETIMGSTDLSEDYVFLTKSGAHALTDIIWLVKRHEPSTHLVQFYKIEPEDKIGIITVQCMNLGGNLTQVKVTYEYIGLSQEGDKFIEQYTSSRHQAMIDKWNALLVSYFESKI